MFGPFKKFDRGEIYEILRRSQLVFFNEGDIIDLYYGAIFIEGEAVGKRVEPPRTYTPLVREETEGNISNPDQEMRPGIHLFKDSMASELGDLSRMEQHLNDL